MAHEDADPQTHPCRAAWRDLYCMDPDTAIDAIIWGNRRWRRLEGVIDQAIAAIGNTDHRSRDPAVQEVHRILMQHVYDERKQLPAEAKP